METPVIVATEQKGDFKLLEKIQLPVVSFAVYPRIYRIQYLRNNAELHVHESPTQNCQVFSVVPFYKLFVLSKAYPDILQMIKDIKELCEIKKPLLHIDVQKEIFDQVSPYVKVYSQMDYINFTESKMVNALIRV